MNQLLSFIRKEFYHILRDKPTIMILLLMPIIQIILFGFALSTEVKDTRIAVLIPDNDIRAVEISNQIHASKYFDVVEVIYNSEQIQSCFARNSAKMVVVFENKFSDMLRNEGKANVMLVADATDPNASTSFAFYVSNIIRNYQAVNYGNNAGAAITPEIKMLYNPQMISAFNFVPGVLGMILLLICAMMTSIAIVREKEMGTMEILLVSPMKPLYIVFSKISPYFVLSIINFTTTLLLAVFVLGVPVQGSIFTLIFISLLYILVALALGLLVSTVTNSQVAAMLFSGMGFMIPVMLLSGMIFPVENMPLPLQILSNIIPARWYISAVKAVMIQGLGIEYLMKEIAILSGMAILLLTISIKKFKVRLM